MIKTIIVSVAMLCVGSVYAVQFNSNVDLVRQAGADLKESALKITSVEPVGQTPAQALALTWNEMDIGTTSRFIKRYINDRGMKVVFVKQEKAVTVSSDGSTILLSNALPPSPRVFAPLIARAVAEMSLGDMPACAERSYMAVSYEARVWREMGNHKETLPVIDPLTGYRDEEAGKIYGLWLNNNQEMALYKIAKETGTQDIGMTDADKTVIRVVERRFNDFMIDDEYWWIETYHK